MPVKTCAICGKEYQALDHRSVTCGDRECVRERKVRHNRDARQKKAMEKMAKLPIRYCCVCNAAYKSLNPMQKTCGDKDCMVESLRIYERARKIPRREMTCPICGKTYIGRANQKTCGERRCYDKHNMIMAELNGFERKPPQRVKEIAKPAVPPIDTMPCPWASGQLDTLPPGVRSWDDPIMCFDGRGWTDGVWIETNEIAEVRAA